MDPGRQLSYLGGWLHQCHMTSPPPWWTWKKEGHTKNKTTTIIRTCATFLDTNTDTRATTQIQHLHEAPTARRRRAREEELLSLKHPTISSPWKEHITGASQTQLHALSRPGHTGFNLIRWQLMDVMWLSVNTRAAETWAATQKTGSLATAAVAFISDFRLFPP